MFLHKSPLTIALNCDQMLIFETQTSKLTCFQQNEINKVNVYCRHNNSNPWVLANSGSPQHRAKGIAKFYTRKIFKIFYLDEFTIASFKFISYTTCLNLARTLEILHET